MNLEIANRLLQLRKENQLSQEGLAEKIGVSRQAVSKWERAEASPDTDNLILLARLYNVSVDELLKTEEPVEPTDIFDIETKESKEEPEHAEHRCVRKHPGRCFPYPLFIIILYLAIGYFTDAWHPAWILFLTIPIYYWVV